MSRLSHIDDKGRATMVDVSAKEATERVAMAEGVVTMAPETLALIEEGGTAKGDVLATARLAGITGAKRTSDLIPLCHPLELGQIAVDLTCDPETSTVRIESTVRLTGRTGAEMEALTAVAIAALTIYDMCKAVDRGIIVGPLRLVYKSGGKSGTYDVRDENPPAP